MRANRYVSYLGAEIEPKAISNLARYEQLTEATMNKLERLGMRTPAALGGGIVSPTSLRGLQQTRAAATATANDIARVGTAARRTAAETGLMATSLTRASQALNVVQGPLGPLAGRLGALSGVLRELAGVSLAGVLGGGAAFAVGSIASNYQAVTDRLRPYYETQEQVNKAMTDIIGIAGRTRQALDPVAELYTRITTAGRDAGIAQERFAKITETVAKAARLSGTSQQAQTAGLQQFAQGFGSGTLSGDELKSIRENLPRLASAISQGLDMPIAKLKELGAAGQLTPQVIADALERSAAKIDLEMSRVPIRIGTALTQSNNNITTFIGRMDEAVGATTGIAKGIMLLGDNIPGVVTALGTLAVALNAKGLVTTGTALTKLIGRTVDYRKSLVDTTSILNNRIAIEQALAQRATTRATAEIAAAAAARSAADQARVGARQAIADGQAAERQLEKQIILLKQQQAQQQASLRTAQLLAAANAAKNGVQAAAPGVAPPATAAATAAGAALARTNLAIAATEKALAAAQAETRAATVRSTGTFYQQVAAMNDVAVAKARLIAATRAQAIADAAAAAAAARATVAQRIMSGAVAAGNAVARLATAAWTGLSAVLGGPVGIALTAATGLMLYLTLRTDEAAAAADRFNAKQDDIAAKLGITIDKLQGASKAAKELAINLADVDLQTSMNRRRDTRQDLADALNQAGKQGDILSSFKALGGKQDQDREAIDRIANEIRNSRNISLQRSSELYNQVSEIQKRRPDIFTGILGRNPEKINNLMKGLLADTAELADQEKRVADTRKAAAKAPPILAAPRSKAQLDAEIKAEAAGNNELKKLRAARAKIEADFADKKLTPDEYVSQAAEADKAINAYVDGQKAARAATAASNKARREAAAAARQQTVEDNRAAAAAEKLADIMARYDEQPRAIDRARDDKRALQALIGQRIDKGDRTEVYTKEDYKRASDQIDQQVRKPAQDALRDQQREIEYIKLAMQGREDEAEVLRQKYQIIDQIGDMLPEEEAKWRANNQAIFDGNRALEERGALIDVYAQQIGDINQAARNFLADMFSGDAVGAAKNLFKNLKQAFVTSKANEIAIKLFGNPEQKFRDQMTRGLNNSATKLSTSATQLSAAASELSAAATAGVTAGNPMSGISPLSPLTSLIPGADMGLKSIGDMAAEVADLAASINDDIMKRGGMQAPEISSDIVVTAAKAVAAAPPAMPNRANTKDLPKNATEAMNKAAKDVFGSIFGQNNPLTKAAGKLGTFFEGAGYGTLAGSIVKGLGVKTSTTGSAIGGGLGQIGGEALGKTFASALGSLGQFAGPLGAIAGGIIGGVIGGLFKKTPKASATITSVNADTGISRVSGSSTNLKNQATGLAASVQQGLQQVADAFGGTADGAFAVSIGTRKGKYRVDPTGRGKTKGGSVADFGEDADAAVKYAILDAIMDGAVKGIREGSLRLLKAGKDLDASLTKALKFEQVFTDLKTYLDPVGAAVDALNKEFNQLISLFGEAGASAEEYAQLEQLYAIKREEAIKNATNSALTSIRDLISSMTAGADSPLDKRTVYTNAQKEAEAVKAKINSGGLITDEDLKKLEQLDAASRALYGSRAAYFADFNEILALAKKAEGNYTSSYGTVPGSPFETAEVKATLTNQLTEAQKQTTLLEQIATAMNLARVAAGGYNGSTIGLLPVNQS